MKKQGTGHWQILGDRKKKKLLLLFLVLHPIFNWCFLFIPMKLYAVEPRCKECDHFLCEPLDEFVKNLEKLRKKLNVDGETCKELHDTIIEIEGEFEEDDVVGK